MDIRKYLLFIVQVMKWKLESDRVCVRSLGKCARNVHFGEDGSIRAGSPRINLIFKLLTSNCIPPIMKSNVDDLEI
jgi:hypothetical protein